MGVDIASGRLTCGVQFNKPVDEHPDTLVDFTGRELPDWADHLCQAARCYDLTDLGYLGVDMVLDKSKGPVLLEVNARPGLSIQIANDTGLADRLKAAADWPGHSEDPKTRVKRARRAFAASGAQTGCAAVSDGQGDEAAQ